MTVRFALPALRRDRTADSPVVQAAGRLVDFDSTPDLVQSNAARQSWQMMASQYAEAIPEFAAAEMQLGRAVAKLRFVAQIVDASGKPVPDKDPTANLLVGTLATLDTDRAARNLFVTAIVHLIVRNEQSGSIRWTVASTDELQVPAAPGQAPLLVDSPIGNQRPLWTADAMRRPGVIDVWKPSRRYASVPWAPTAALLKACETITIIDAAMRAYYLHRLTSAGVLYLPSEAMLPRVANEGPNGTLTPTPLQRFNNAASVVIRNPGSPQSLVPIIITGPAEYADAFKRFDMLAAEHHEKLVNDRRVMLETLANGLDWVASDVNQAGQNDAKYANLRTLDGKGKVDYAMPYGSLIADAITRSWYHNALRQLGVSPVGRLVGVDASDLIGRADRSSVTIEARRMGLITREAAVDALGFSVDTEMMMPGTPEYEAWMTETRLSQGLQSLDQLADEDPNAPATPPSNWSEDPLSATLATLDAELGPRTAAAGVARKAEKPKPDPLLELSARLAEIDRAVETKLQSACELALTSALRKAGARVKSKANGHKSVTAAIARLGDIDRALLPAGLGEPIVAALGLSEDQVLADSFDELGDHVTEILDEATGEAAAAIAATLAVDTPALMSHAKAAVDALKTAMLNLARRRLWHPDPEVPDAGEVPVSLRVPPSIVAEVMARAGGADVRAADGAIRWSDATPEGLGPATSNHVDSAIRAAWNATPAPPNTPKRDIPVDGAGSGPGLVRALVWEHGRPKVPFEPHRRLDGYVFEDWTDAGVGFQPGDDTSILGADAVQISGWRIGDHRGCTCRVRTVWLEPGTDVGEIQTAWRNGSKFDFAAQRGGWRKGDRYAGEEGRYE